MALGPVSKRIRGFLRTWIILVPLFAVGVVVVVSCLNPQGGLSGLLTSAVGPTIFLTLLLVAGLSMLAIARIRYPRSTKTRTVAAVLDPLVASGQEYCLVLRPFGSDAGTVVLRRPRLGYLSPTVTLEQIVAASIRRTTGMTTYAMVDQNQVLGAPGLTYMRASLAEWRSAVRVLISRAHTIVLLLPPKQAIREAFAWEIEQVTQCNFQSRVILVLPPCGPRDDLAAYWAARQQACIVLASLEGFAGTVSDTGQEKIDHYDRILPERMVLAKVCDPSGMREFGPRPVKCWGLEQPFGRKLVTFHTYHNGLADLAKTAVAELSGLSFAARYPWRIT